MLAFCHSHLKTMHNITFSDLAELASHLLPEWRPCGESMQLKLVALKVEQGQVETLNLDQHLHTSLSRFPQITKVRVVSRISNVMVVSSNKPACNQPLSSWALLLVQDCRPQGWGSQCFEPCVINEAMQQQVPWLSEVNELTTPTSMICRGVFTVTT